VTLAAIDLNQAQKHADSVGVQTLPTFVVRWMAVASTISPPCLLQIALDACSSRRSDIYALLVEMTQEIARRRYALT